MDGENTARTAENLGQNDTRTADSPQQSTAKRERSSIGFPYDPLDEAIAVARAIHSNVGTGDCDDAQLSPSGQSQTGLAP